MFVIWNNFYSSKCYKTNNDIFTCVNIFLIPIPSLKKLALTISFCIYYTTPQQTLSSWSIIYVINCRKRLMRYNVQSYSYKRTTKRLESRDHNCSKHIVHSCSVIVLNSKTGFFIVAILSVSRCNNMSYIKLSCFPLFLR